MSVTLTTNYSFHKYDDGDIGWGAGMRNNFDRLDAYLYELYNRRLPAWLTGTSVPDGSVGLSGDMFILSNDADQLNNGKVYQKVGNSWNYKAQLKGAVGATGAAGTNGAQGIQGVPGLSGTQWFYYIGAPGAGIGRPGDFSLDTSNGDVYNKDSNGWQKIASLLGPQGLQGPPGVTGPQAPTIWYQGEGAPVNLTGQNGDFYLDRLNGNLYVKQSNTWNLIPLTAQNISGIPVWRSSTSNPLVGEGIDGDYHLNTAAGTIWLKSAGTWSVISLAGGGGGTGWLHGTVDPLVGVGVDEDMYINTVTGTMWLKQAGVWEQLPVSGNFSNLVLDLLDPTILPGMIFEFKPNKLYHFSYNGHFSKYPTAQPVQHFDYSSFRFDYDAGLSTNLGELSPDEIQVDLSDLTIRKTDFSTMNHGDLFARSICKLEPSHGDEFSVAINATGLSSSTPYSQNIIVIPGGVMPTGFTVNSGILGNYKLRVYQNASDQTADSSRDFSTAPPYWMNVVEIDPLRNTFKKEVIPVDVDTGSILYVTVYYIGAGSGQTVTMNMKYRMMWRSSYAHPSHTNAGASTPGFMLSDGTWNGNLQSTQNSTLLTGNEYNNSTTYYRTEVGTDVTLTTDGSIPNITNYNWSSDAPYSAFTAPLQYNQGITFVTTERGVYDVICDFNNGVIWDRHKATISVFSVSLPATLIAYGDPTFTTDTVYNSGTNTAEPSISIDGMVAVYTKFNGTTDDNITITAYSVNNPVSGAVNLRILDSSYNNVGSASSSGNGYATITLTLLTTDTFYIECAVAKGSNDSFDIDLLLN